MALSAEAMQEPDGGSRSLLISWHTCCLRVRLQQVLPAQLCHSQQAVREAHTCWLATRQRSNRAGASFGRHYQLPCWHLHGSEQQHDRLGTATPSDKNALLSDRANGEHKYRRKL